MAFIILPTIAQVLHSVFRCSPPQANWMKRDADWMAAHPDVQCGLTPQYLTLLASGFALLTDVFSIALPIYIVWRLSKLSPSQRIGLVMLFSSSFVVIAARCGLIYHLSRKLSLVRQIPMAARWLSHDQQWRTCTLSWPSATSISSTKRQVVSLTVPPLRPAHGKSRSSAPPWNYPRV